MKVILHISADYPDAIVPNKTNAVRALLESQTSHRHLVYSLNRTDGLRKIEGLPFGGDHVAVTYEAPPRGILHHTRLKALARWIGDDLDRRNIRPDLLHCHKLTVEGLIGLELKARFGCPMIVSVQGDTDTKILDTRIDLRPVFRVVALQSAALISVSAWPLAHLRKTLGGAIDKCLVLPAISQVNSFSTAMLAGTPRLASTFHLLSWRRKGADTLARAASIAAKDYPGLVIDIYGGGPPDKVLALEQTLRALDPKGHVRLAGPIEPENLVSTLGTYAGYVMPSRRETYGMAYVEALFSGLPLVHARGRGVDGMIPAQVGYACDPFDVKAVAEGMVRLLANEATLKAAVSQAQADGSLTYLTAAHIAATYGSLLEKTLTSGR